MYITIVILGVFAHLSNGVPIETSSTDLKTYFDSRIVGGVEAPHGHAPHMAALAVGHHYKSLVCGGSIISSKHIMTAAHCIDSFITWEGGLLPSFHAIVGTNTWNSGGVIVEFKGFVNHPQWNPFDIKNDIGILDLSEKLKFNDVVKIIPLNYDWVSGGENSFVTGWGTTSFLGPIPNKLQFLEVWTLTPIQCQDGVRDFVGQWGWAPPIYPEVEICTFHSPNHGMCHGDSGSALVLKKGGKQIGIVSWGFPCAVGAPDVFTRVSGFKEFILNVLGGQPRE